MKLITELIRYAIERNMLTEANKRKLQADGFYTFYYERNQYKWADEYDEDDHCREEYESAREEELDRKYYGDFYHPGNSSDRGRHGKRPPVGPKLTVEELNQRVQEDWKRLMEEFPNLAPLWDSWKAGKLERVFADGFTLNDVYGLVNVEPRDFQEFSGPAPTAYRQLLRQVENIAGKYSWVIKSLEMASMVEFPRFRQQILQEVGALYETDRERFGVLSSQNGKLDFPNWEKAVQTDTTSMKVWTILNLSSMPVTPKRIEEIQTWKPELALAMQINLDYITELLTKLEQRDWSSLIVITDREIENANLKSVVIPEDAPAVENDAFSYCRSLTSVTISENVQWIGFKAFYDCRSLKSVTIPEGVKWIRNRAFCNCSSLTSVVIPKGVQWIGSETFCNCSSLTSMTIPKGLSVIEIRTFNGCSSLKSAAIPEGVEWIGVEAFRDCSSLSSVTIPEGVKEIRNDAFNGCSSLKSVSIPESVTTIGIRAFNGCSSLMSVSIPDGVETIGDKAFYGCAAPGKVLMSNDKRFLLNVNQKISGEFVIPESVRVIAPHSFQGCDSLTSVSIPKGVTEIGNGAFEDCISLASVEFPEGVIEIGSSAFRDCHSLTSVALPDSVKEIGSYSFENNRSITSVTIPEGVKIGNEAFYGCAAPGKALLSDDKKILLNVHGDFSGKFVIPESVKVIAPHSFRGCKSLTSVSIPKDVKKIGNGAFKDCCSLTSVEIPEGVTEIGFEAFRGCSSLTSMEIPKGMSKIPDRMFSDCSSLTSVEIPEGVTEIGDSAFESCRSLTSVAIPDGVTTIGTWSFEYCSSLKSLLIPDGVTTIGSWAFCDCSSLKSVAIPKSVKSIGDSTFGKCPYLTLYAPAGSYAEKYAKENRIHFRPLEEDK